MSKHFRILNWVSNFRISLRKFLACLVLRNTALTKEGKKTFDYSSKQLTSSSSSSFHLFAFMWLGEVMAMMNNSFLLTNQAIFKRIGGEN